MTRLPLLCAVAALAAAPSLALAQKPGPGVAPSASSSAQPARPSTTAVMPATGAIAPGTTAVIPDTSALTPSTGVVSPNVGPGINPNVPLGAQTALTNASARVPNAANSFNSSHAQACAGRYRSYNSLTDSYTNSSGRTVRCSLAGMGGVASRPPVATSALPQTSVTNSR